MCGFAGYILGNTSWQNKQETSKDLFTVANQIFHRGPDARDFFISEYHKIGVAFQRLSILDLSKDAMQPMVSHCKKWVMVFNGEIYNFKNLKKNLSHRKIAWNTNSDTEVILELISYFGFEKAIPMLDGMFSIMAFSLSDRSCWLARDKFGEKPLYYCKDKENNFFFSSDLKALMSSKYYNKKIDYKVSVDYLRYGFVPDPLCILENTYKLSY